MTNNGLPPLTINGDWVETPASSSTDTYGRIVFDFSPTGPPMVGPEGSTYLGYEVRNIAYGSMITSAELYLLKIGMDGSRSHTTQSTTTENQSPFVPNL